MTDHSSPRFLVVATLILGFASPLVSHAEVSFEKDLLPVLTKRCFDCHRATHVVDGKKKEPKGDVRLDAAWAMIKGTKDGPIVYPKAADKSPLYNVLTVPVDDDMHMPPKGDPLTPDQVKLVKLWIDEGANFGTWEGNTEGRPTQLGAEGAAARKREHEEFYKALEAGAKPVPESTLKQLQAGGAQVATLTGSSPLLRADFLTGVSRCDDAKVAKLLPAADNIAHLDLGRTAITDAALAIVGKLPRLARLDLRQTKVTDKGLESLTGLKKLQVLNLYGTEITDAGLDTLAQIKSLKQVFVWQSKATEAGAKKLQAALPGAVVVAK